MFGVSLRIERGEIVTIVGPNGSGKSTLLRCLIGAQRLTKGRILKAAGLKVGYVPQKLHIDPTLPITVRRFLDLPVRVSRDEAEGALERAGAEGLADRQLADLSGGQLQRVLLARAILGGPDILMLDEPTQGLDQPGAAAFTCSSAKSLKCSWMVKFGVHAARCRFAAVSTGPPTLCGAMST